MSQARRRAPKQYPTACKDLKELYPDVVEEPENVNKNPYLPQHPYRLSLIGPTGAGKTTILGSLLALNPCFDELYILALDHDELLYKALQDDPRLVLLTANPDEMPTFEELRQNPASKCIIIDDMVAMTPLQLKPVVELYIAGRKANASCVYLSQSFHKGIPITIRQQLSGIILTRNLGNSLGNLGRIIREFAADMDAKKMLAMYKLSTTPDHDKDRNNFFWIDTAPKDPQNRFRRGFGQRMVWKKPIEAVKTGDIGVAKLDKAPLS